MLIIAHRLRSVENCDQIVVLDNGQLREIGDHDELMNKNGLYQHLFEIQRKTMSWGVGKTLY